MSVSDMRVRFAKDGFVMSPRLVGAADIEQVRSLLDPLFDRFDTFGASAVDLAGPVAPGVGRVVPEIKRAVALEPRLRRTAAYRNCRQLARRILRAPVRNVFDHAVFKQPNTAALTDWHQDAAYNSSRWPVRSVHFWIPLQPVTESNGCLSFIPGSHRKGLQPHGSTPRSAGVNFVATVDPVGAVVCPMEIGDISLHDPLTMHFAGANQSSSVRRAWILHFSTYVRLGRSERSVPPAA